MISFTVLVILQAITAVMLGYFVAQIDFTRLLKKVTEKTVKIIDELEKSETNTPEEVSGVRGRVEVMSEILAEFIPAFFRKQR